MKVFCSYHPTKPAQWECPNCNETYCAACISKRVSNIYGSKQVHFFCPNCNVAANKLSAGNLLEPFWNRLPKIFLYPIYPRTLGFMISIALISAIFRGPGFLTFIMNLLAWGALLKYSFAALKNTASGSLTPPRITFETLSDNFQVVFKQLAIFMILFFLLSRVSNTLGPIPALLSLCFVCLSFPSIITVLVITDSLIAACNPLIFVRMAWRIGWGYLLMYLFLILLLFAPSAIGQYIIKFFPEGLHIFLFSLAKCYYMIIAYHLMGYVMVQYHEEIGWDVDLEDEIAIEEEAADPGERIVNRADMLIKDGKMDEAIAYIKDETGGEISDVNIAERYYKLLKLKQQVPEMLEHGKGYLDLLTKEKQWDKVCQVYGDCSEMDKDFSPGSSTLFKIGGLLNERNNPKGAIDAYSRFVKADPQNPLTPKAYFLSAGIMNEKLKLPQKAAQILRGVIKKYPDSDIVPHVENYLKKVTPA